MTGLTKVNFSVWELTTIGAIDVYIVTEVNQTFPSSKMPGVYRVQTQDFLGTQSPPPQQFVHAIRVSYTAKKINSQGIATTAVSYLGNLQ